MANMNVWAFARRVGMDVCKPQLTFPTCTQAQSGQILTQVHSLLDIFTHMSCEFRLIAVADQLEVKWSPLKQRLLTTLNLQVKLYV